MRNTSSPRLAAAALALVAGLAPPGAGATAQIAPRRGFGPGRCGPVDPAYVQGANPTGGQLFLMGASEMPSADQIATTRLVISSMFDNTGGTLDVRAPDGTAVEANDRVVDTRLNCVCYPDDRKC
jgi:hypothetical protein